MAQMRGNAIRSTVERKGAGFASMLGLSMLGLTIISAPAQAATRSAPADTATTIKAAPAPQQFAQTRRRGGGDEGGASAGGVPGRYAVLRENDKDAGCLVNLQAGGRARVGPGCADQGMVVFDPLSWSADRNHIVLRARKGHRITLERQPTGVYLRTPAADRPLALRKF